MAFWIFMLLCCLITPGIMLCFGRSWIKNPPKKINSLYGYRTSMSMKNMDTWKFAHRYCGKLWWKIGWVMLCVTAAAMIFVIGGDADTVGIVGIILMVVQCAVILLTIVPLEAALHREFDSQGCRKS